MNDEELWRGFAQVLRTRPVIGLLGAAILILASLKVIDFLPPLHNTAAKGKPTVDISFSLECRDLEGVPNERLGVGVKDYEDMSARVAKERTKEALDRLKQYEKDFHIKYYNTGAQFAVVHGEPDSDAGTTPGLAGMRVTKATPEAVTLEGLDETVLRHEELVRVWQALPVPASRASADGYVNRRTGHAQITWYNHDHEVLRQWMYECEPAKPAKF